MNKYNSNIKIISLNKNSSLDYIMKRKIENDLKEYELFKEFRNCVQNKLLENN